MFEVEGIEAGEFGAEGFIKIQQAFPVGPRSSGGQLTNTTCTVAPANYVGNYGTLIIAEADGRLILKNGRRPIRTLLSLGDDRFAVKEDPSQRMVFVRDAGGKVEALESQTSSGESTRYRRGG